MIFSSEQIEVITQCVLRELRSRGVALAAADSVQPQPGMEAVDDRTDSDCTTSEKVITEDTLAALDAAGRTVRIPPGAIITPSGHDYIRRNHLTVTSGGTAQNVSSQGIVIAMESSSAPLSAAATAGWQTIEAGCEFEAASQAKSSLPAPVVCCVAEPSTTACLLNRDTGVRAAVITHNTNVDLLGSVMNPHVVCLNPVGWSFAALLKLLRQFAAAGHEVPTNWKELAGGNR